MRRVFETVKCMFASVPALTLAVSLAPATLLAQVPVEKPHAARDETYATCTSLPPVDGERARRIACRHAARIDAVYEAYAGKKLECSRR